MSFLKCSLKIIFNKVDYSYLRFSDFAEVRMSQLLVSPETSKILADIHTFSKITERPAPVAEQMPDKVMKDVSKIHRRI